MTYMENEVGIEVRVNSGVMPEEGTTAYHDLAFDPRSQRYAFNDLGNSTIQIPPNIKRMYFHGTGPVPEPLFGDVVYRKMMTYIFGEGFFLPGLGREKIGDIEVKGMYDDWYSYSHGSNFIGAHLYCRLTGRQKRVMVDKNRLFNVQALKEKIAALQNEHNAADILRTEDRRRTDAALEEGWDLRDRWGMDRYRVGLNLQNSPEQVKDSIWSLRLQDLTTAQVSRIFEVVRGMEEATW